MWLFTRKPKPKPSQSVQRHISIRTRDDQGESGEARFVYDQGQGTSFRTAFPVRETADTASEVEDNETASTSSSTSVSNRRSLQIAGPSRNFGSYPREPLDPTVWSNVTSPGFTTRMVQQAHNNSMDGVGSGSPLKEILSNRSPFTRSPNGHLRVGQLPVEAVPRRPGVLNFPSPTKRRSILTFGRYSRVAKRDAKYGTVFVKLAPIHSKGAAPPVTPSKPSPSLGTQGVNYNESNVAGGLGGVPPSPCGLSQRLSRLWPNKSPRQSSASNSSQLSSGPNTILEALANRKRGREMELSSYDSSMRQSSGPKAFTSPDEISKYSKRVKFVNEQDMRLYSPLMFNTYEDANSCGAEPLTSKSILEQMNQTEKRFLPDSSLEPSHSKRHKSIGSPRGTSTPILRKRRSDSRINLLEGDEDATFDDHKTKNVKLCDCNQCYEEAAGSPTMQASPVKSSESPTGIRKKTVTFDDTGMDRSNRHSTSWADQGTETDLVTGPPEVTVRKSIRTSGHITMEKYEFDRNMRVERFRRILGLNKAAPTANQSGDVFGSVSSNPSTSNANAFNLSGSQASNPNGVVVSTGQSQPQSLQQPEVADNSVQSQPQTSQGGFNFSSQTTSLGLGTSLANQNAFSTQQNVSTPAETSRIDVVDAASSKPSTSNAFNFGGSQTLSNSNAGVVSTGQSQPQSPPQPEITVNREESQSSQGGFNFSTPATTVGVGVLPTNQNVFTAQKNLSSSTANPPSNVFESVASNPSTSNAFNFGGSNTLSNPNVGEVSTGQSQPESKPQPEVAADSRQSQPQTSQGGFTFSPQVTGLGLGTSLANQNATQQNASNPVETQVSNVLDSATSKPSTSSTFNFGGSQTPSYPNVRESSTALSQPQSPPQPEAAANSGQTQPQTSQGGFNFSTPTTTLGVGIGTLPAHQKAFSSQQNLSSSAANPSSNVFGAASTSLLTSNAFNFGSSQTQSNLKVGEISTSQSQPESTPQTEVAANSGQPQTSQGGFNFSNSTTASGIGTLPANQNVFSTQQNVTSSIANPSSNVFGSASSNPSTSNAFNFGGSQTPSNSNAGFSFGQLQSSPQVAANSGQLQPQTSQGGFNFSNQATTSGIGTLPANQNVFSTQQNLSSSIASPSNNVFGSASSNPSTSNAFSFGGSQTQSNPIVGGFPFGQPQSSPQVAANSGQVQPQAAQGGFNFSNQSTTLGIGNWPAKQNVFSAQQNLSSSTANPSSNVFGSASSNPSTSNAFNFGGSQTQLNASVWEVSTGQTQPQSPPHTDLAANSGQPQPQTSQGGFNFSTPATTLGIGNWPAKQNAFSTQQSLAGSTANPSSNVFGAASSNMSTSNAFNFGGSQTQSNTNAGGFSFGQPQSSPQVAANSGQPLNQFGQPQTPQGGFNFATQASPAFGDAQSSPGNNMFTLGTSASAPRRRGMRRYR